MSNVSERYVFMVENDLLDPPTPPRKRRTNAEIQRDQIQENQMLSKLASDLLPDDVDYFNGQSMWYYLLEHQIIVDREIGIQKAWNALRNKYFPDQGWEVQKNPASKSGRYKTPSGRLEVFKRKSSPKLTRKQLQQLDVL